MRTRPTSESISERPFPFPAILILFREIKTDSSPEDGDQTVAPPSKRAKIPKKAKAKTHAATIKDEDEDEDEGADING